MFFKMPRRPKEYSPEEEAQPKADILEILF